MSQSDLLSSLMDGTAPKHMRLLAARRQTPFPPREMLALLVALLGDKEQDVATQAGRTIADLDDEEILAQMKFRDCAPSVLAHFASTSSSDPVLQAIIMHPSTPPKSIESLASNVPAHLLEAILDNRARILEFPDILLNVRRNAAATPEIQRQVQEIEAEFLRGKKKDYRVDRTSQGTSPPDHTFQLSESDIPLEELSLEGLPVDPEARQSALLAHLSKLQIREKLRYALFGSREIRMALVRDSNKQVARMVLRSPKLTENEVQAISSMRNVTDEILRDIGLKKEWTKSYKIVRNLVKNPKTPPLVSQRLLFRLQLGDLKLLTRDKNIPEAVRRNAINMVNQRAAMR
jgi:hypothetical protein